MIIQPSSSVTLYRDVAISDGEQIAFSSEANQKAYFAARKVVSLDNVTYVRRTGTIKMEWPTSTVSQCNYISFTNPAFENITFYARIVDYNYINNVTTEISYAIDWFQSFMFKLQYDKCGILRQHLNQKGKQESDAAPWKMTENTVELFTAEDLPVSSDLLDRAYRAEDGAGSSNTFVEGSTTQYVADVLQVVDFDTAQIDTFPDFLKNFSYVVTPDGTVVQKTADLGTALLGDLPMNGYSGYIGRSYWLFIRFRDDIDVTNPSTIWSWLELNGLTSSVLGLYSMGLDDIKDLLSDLHLNSFGTNKIVMGYPDKSQYVNKKLCLYPYNYLRVKSVMGTEKEYKWELFSPGYNGVGEDAEFTTRYLMDNAPYRTVVPVGYGESITYPVDGQASEIENYSERLDTPPATQLPYATDSYLTFLSNKYMSAAGQVTSVQGALQAFSASDVGAGLTVANEFIKSALSIGGQIVSGMNSPTGAPGLLVSQPKSTGLISTIASKADAGVAYNTLFGGSGEPGIRGMEPPKGSQPIGPWTEARQAYVQSNYHAATVDGGVAFHTKLGLTPTSILFIKQQLRPEIMRRYDEYFSLYGYSSRRYDLPWVCYFMQGSQDPAKLPAWDTSMGDAQTYIKTQDMHVFGVPEVIAAQVEAIFDAGMFVKNGDTL